MKLEHFKKNLQKNQDLKSEFSFSISKGASNLNFKQVEEKLNISIPEKTKEFYLIHNGFKTNQPDFELLSLDNWSKSKNEQIHFATFDSDIKVCFNTENINSANQWTIINQDSKYEITLSMSSFWSNKIWHWLRNEKKIWNDEYWK
jgi:hypothetical protein